MRTDEDERSAPGPSRETPPRHEIGENLDALSVEEIDARVALLRREIERLEGAMAGKRVSRDAADAVFKR